MWRICDPRYNFIMSTPPRLAERFLCWFLRAELREEVQGDLLERYEEMLATAGHRQANRHYWYQVFNYLRPFAIRPDLLTIHNPLFMLSTHLKLAWRKLRAQKLHTGINLAGMTIGITCCILIGLYIKYEYSYDRQHELADRIYRVVQRQPGNEFQGTNAFALSPVDMATSLKANFAEVEEATVMGVEDFLVARQQDAHYQKGVYADSAFLALFDYPALAGDAQAALYNPGSIILTESMARKYFGKASPLGETLTLHNDTPVTVAAVIADVPNNQHIDFDFITAIQNFPYYQGDKERYKWGSNNYRAYLLLEEGQSATALGDKLTVLDEIAKPFYGDFLFYPEYFLQRLTDIHLHSQLNMELKANSDIRYVYLAASIGIIILLLAFVNYLNLANARTAQRIKAIGVRKVLGAEQRQVVGQLMTESLLLVSISFGLAVVLSKVILPFFNQLLDVPLSFGVFQQFGLLFTLLGGVLLVGVLASLYPAMVAATVPSVQALKGKRSNSQRREKWVKAGLVVGQFAAAIVLAICTIVIYQQLHYTQNKAVGFDREQVVYIPYQDQDVLEKADVIRSSLLQHPAIADVAFGSNLPLHSENQGIADEWEGNTNGDEQPIYRNWIDYNYLDLLGIELVEGRNFSRSNTTDASQSYLLNEAAVKALGWEEGVGKAFEDGQVVGVVKDFHFQPFQLAIEPMFLRIYNEYTSRYGNVIVKLKPGYDRKTMVYIEDQLAEHLPTLPAGIRHLDESYASLYDRERRFGQVFQFFAGLAIFIACLGLFGLITHSVVQRTREIGVRKVLGASSAQLVALLSGRFVWQVGIAAIVAAPVAWWAMQTWLQAFAYRISLEWWVFVVASLGALLLALVTTGTQAWRAAGINPAETLKE